MFACKILDVRTVIACCCLSMTGCYTMETIDRDAIKNESSLAVAKVVTVDDSVYLFRSPEGDYAVVQDSVISGILVGQAPKAELAEGGGRVYKITKIPIAKIDHIEVRKINTELTVLALATTVVATTVIVLAVMFANFHVGPVL